MIVDDNHDEEFFLLLTDRTNVCLGTLFLKG